MRFVTIKCSNHHQLTMLFDDLEGWGRVWHPGSLVQPDHAAAQGQPSTEPLRVSVALPPGGRVIALEGEAPRSALRIPVVR